MVLERKIENGAARLTIRFREIRPRRRLIGRLLLAPLVVIAGLFLFGLYQWPGLIVFLVLVAGTFVVERHHQRSFKFEMLVDSKHVSVKTKSRIKPENFEVRREEVLEVQNVGKLGGPLGFLLVDEKHPIVFGTSLSVGVRAEIAEFVSEFWEIPYNASPTHDALKAVVPRAGAGLIPG